MCKLPLIGSQIVGQIEGPPGLWWKSTDAVCISNFESKVIAPNKNLGITVRG